MPAPRSRDPHAATGVLLVGPGPRARELGAILVVLGAPRGVETRTFGDLTELGLEPGRGGLLLLDVDATPLEDVGYVRRFAAAHAQVELVMLGSDAGSRTARALGSQRFAHWPPDVEELAHLVVAANEAAHATTRTRPPIHSAPPTASSAAFESPRRTDRPSADADEDELEHVRAILEEEAESDRPDTSTPAAERARRGRTHDAHGASPDTGLRHADVTRAADPFSGSEDPGRGRRPREEGVSIIESGPGLREQGFVPRGNGAVLDEEDFGASVEGRDPGRELHAPRGEAHAPRGDAQAHRGESHERRDGPRGDAPLREQDHAAQPDFAIWRASNYDAAQPGAPRAAIDAPPWWRAQVADLADAAQRIDLSVKMLAQAAPEIDEGDLDDARARLRELEGEVARLLQFTRTLGYVAAPPPAGSQTFDLGEIVHLFAAGLAQSGPEAPRCQYKTSAGAVVRSDRQLLSQALDAVFFLVRCTSRKGDLVRAQVQRLDVDDAPWIEMSLDFPSGPLEGFPQEDVVSPYSLSDLFPELGPNALAAAAGIVAGQEGRLTLVNRAPGRMTWHLRLPRAGS